MLGRAKANSIWRRKYEVYFMGSCRSLTLERPFICMGELCPDRTKAVIAQIYV